MPRQLRLDDSNLPEYLRNTGLLGADETVSVEPAGDGNINWVRRARVRPDGRSWVVKQARPALERFPEYRVSTDRILVESRYYETTAPLDTARVCPGVVLFDPDARVLVLEDLGDAPPLDAVLEALLQGSPGSAPDLPAAAAGLGAFLGAVHAATRGADLARRFHNDEMRRLHGEHIFALPFQPNDFPLSPALHDRALALQGDRALLDVIAAAYARYLEPRGVLVHGDVQAGNVLLGRNGRARLLDAEIAHIGAPAFDVGVLLAHLLLPAAARGPLSPVLPTAEAAWRSYRAAAGDAAPPFAECARYAGIEMLRRCLGAARVPAVETDGASLAAVERGVALTATPASDLDGLA